MNDRFRERAMYNVRVFAFSYPEPEHANVDMPKVQTDQPREWAAQNMPVLWTEIVQLLMLGDDDGYARSASEV